MVHIPVRFWIASMVFFGTFITYTTRVNLAVSIISMIKSKKQIDPECTRKEVVEGEPPVTQKPYPDYGPRYDWDEKQQGNLLASYFYGYTTTSLFAGPPSEWWGPRVVVMVMQILTAIFNVLSVFCARYHYWALWGSRFMIGAFAGFVYPAIQSLIGSWAPPDEKGKFVGAMMGNTLGICTTWPLVGVVTSYFGWDWGFYVLSIEIAVFCLVWWFVVADDPDHQKCISKEEIEYISNAQAGHVSHQKRTAPLKQILTCIPFWMLVILHSGNLWGLYLQISGVPKFMAEVIGFNLKDSGFASALPHLTRLFLGVGFGFIGDYLKNHQVCKPVVVRKAFVIVSHVIPGLLLIGISFCGCNWVPVLILLTLSLSINGAVVMTNLQNAQDLAPNFAGTIFGIISFLGGCTGFAAPVLTSIIIKDNNGIDEWGLIFIIGGSIYIISGIIFILFGSVEEQSWNKVAE